MRLIPMGIVLLTCGALGGCIAGTSHTPTDGTAGENSGTAGTPGSPNFDASQQAGNGHIPPVSPCTSNAPAPRGLRRLTQVELNNSVQDLLDANAPQTVSVFDSDPQSYGFHNVQAILQVRDNTAQALLLFSEAAGLYASQHTALVSTCTTMELTCRTDFINRFGKRAFRAPLTADQVDAYNQLMASMPDFAAGVQAVVSAMLQSPYFLYRTELGTPVSGSPGTFQLTPYEIASELSYLITASTPDTILMQAADTHALSTDEQILAQAKRLMATPRAHAAVDAFFLQWLQLADLGRATRQEGTDVLDSATKAAMQTETLMLVEDVVFSKNGTYSDLLTAKYTFLNQQLAAFYQLSGPATGFASVPLTGGERPAGVLGHGGVLSIASQSTYASPTMRGRMVRMRLLCNSVSPPPPGVPALDTTTPNQTLRQRFEQHSARASCSSCHALMDPLGFTLGSFDTIGRARAGNMENGLAVDTSGDALDAGTGTKTPLRDASALVDYLATSADAQACFGRHWAMYAYGATHWPQDACTFAEVAKRAAPTHYNLQSTFLSLTQVPSFTQRVQDP